MVDVAKVTMFGENVGTFRWDNTYDVARFEYDAQFIGKGIEPSPLMMPVQQRANSYTSGVPAPAVSLRYSFYLYPGLEQTAPNWPQRD